MCKRQEKKLGERTEKNRNGRKEQVGKGDGQGDERRWIHGQVGHEDGRKKLGNASHGTICAPQTYP